MERTYVVAVSGGVDSVALLDMLVKRGEAALIVAHFDHGIRSDSASDRKFVQDLAAKYGLQFVYDEGNLGAGASEATARDARYAFLRRIKQATGADWIITAHHEDDVLETAIINMIRGTGRKGLGSLRSTDEIYRPLLNTPKSELLSYARENGLEWREDSTNADAKYLRNYVRHNILPRFDPESRQRLRGLIDSTIITNSEIDRFLAWELQGNLSDEGLDRYWLTMLPHDVAREVVASWMRSNGISDFDKKTIERIVIAGKTYAPGKQIDVDGSHIIKVSSKFLALVGRER